MLSRRQFGGLLAGGGVFASSSLARPAQAAEAFDILPYVHPDLRSFAAAIQRYRAPPFGPSTLASLRRGAIASAPAGDGWVERKVPGPRGGPDVRVFIVNGSQPGPARPAILHIHGGGFVSGTAGSAIRTLLPLARTLGCAIVTVDYRLAPETPFPGSLEDNYAALKWLHGHSEELGVDPTRIAVMGESAGGGHAAMLAMAARDRREVPLVFQLLIYPMLDDRTGSTRKVPPYQGAVVWTPDSNRFGWSSLLGVPAGSSHVPEGAVPARFRDLRGLPPAFVGVGSIDLFVDEDIDYARRLMDAGVAVELDVVPGAFHGFDQIPTAPVAQRFRDAYTHALARAFRVDLAT